MNDQLVIAADQRVDFLSGRDIATLDDDPVLERRDWWNHEASNDTIVIDPDEWTIDDTEAVADD